MQEQPPGPFPPQCARRYDVREKIGQGGGGVTFLATQRSLLRPVVVKLPRVFGGLLTRGQVFRFRREARLTAALSHPHVVIVLDHDVEHDVPWIAYEFLPGRNLLQLRATGELDAESALHACRQVAMALEAAHARGILHRDVKPSNVMESGPGHYKLIDFGLAHAFSSDPSATTTGVAGTPAYLAPELLLGEPASPQSDLYALGATLFELLTGRNAFEASGILPLMRQIVEDPVPLPSKLDPSVPRSVDALVRRAMAKDPVDRFASAAEMREAVEAALGLAPAPRSRAGPDPRAACRPLAARLRQRLARACGAALLGILAATAHATFPRVPPAPWVSLPPVDPAACAAARARAGTLIARAEECERAIRADGLEIVQRVVSPDQDLARALAAATRALTNARAGASAARAAAEELTTGADGGAPPAGLLLHARALALVFALHVKPLEDLLRRLERERAPGAPGVVGLPRLALELGRRRHDPALIAAVASHLEDVIEYLARSPRSGRGSELAGAYADLELITERLAGGAWPAAVQRALRRRVAARIGELGAAIAPGHGAQRALGGFFRVVSSW